MKAKVVPIDMTAEWTDELGALQLQLAPWRDKLKRETALKSLLAAKADEDGVKPSVGTLYQGKHYVVAVSERDEKRTIVSLYDVYRASKLKLASFLLRCSITLKDLEAIVPPDARPALISSGHDGPRHVKTYAKAS